jgi:integrase
MQDGRRRSHYIGGSWEGWTLERAEKERQFIIEQVNRGSYVPRTRERSAPSRAGMPSFRDAAEAWLERYRLKNGDPEGTSSASADLEWRLSVVMPKLGPLAVDAIDFAQADDLVLELVQQRLAATRAKQRGRPLMEEIVDPRTGRAHQRERRGLSGGSIRKGLEAAQRVLNDLHARGQLAVAPNLLAAAPRAERPLRSCLGIRELAACIAAAKYVETAHRGLDWEKVRYIRSSSTPASRLARELRISDVTIGRIRRGEIWVDRSEPRSRNDVPRLAVVEGLAFSGLRISELCGLNNEDLDFQDERIRVGRKTTKTDAGERVVPMVPSLRARLIEHRMDVGGGAPEPVFPNRNGKRQTPQNIRARILPPVWRRANQLLAEDHRPPISDRRPHGLRRTFASILALCEVHPRRAMQLLGHTDPRVTLGIYQQPLDASAEELGLLEELLGCSLDRAHDIFAGRTSFCTRIRTSTKNY